MNKIEALKKLKAKMDADKTLPLREGATQLVFGDGNPDTQVYFLGEAPGFFEDREGKPFVGQAGKLLNKLLESIGLERSEVYISNVVRFRPPSNRDPLPEEIAAFQDYVDQEMEIIDPPIVVTLGRFSMGKFLPGVKISQVHGKPRLVEWHGKQIAVVPMYHPAAALRNGNVLNQLKEDFKIISRVIKRMEERKKEKQKEENKEEQLSLL